MIADLHAHRETAIAAAMCPSTLWHPVSDTPSKPGWYVVRLHLSAKPIVLWWGSFSTQWRDGMRAVQAVEWMGPL